MIDLEPIHLQLVRSILVQHMPQASVWAFGSRVQGRAWKFSDLDLAIDANAPITLRAIGLLKEAFQESRLPMKVDVIDLHGVTPEFRALIEHDREQIQRS